MHLVCIARSLALILALPVLIWARPAVAQPTPPTSGHGHGSPPAAPEAHDGAHHSPLVEVEFAGSKVFQSGGLSLRLGSPLRAEVRYFGLDGNDIGTAGLGWELQWAGLRLIPGAAIAFGRENRPAVALTARWVFETETWISQGVWVQSLGDYEQPRSLTHGDGEGDIEPIVRHASVLDGIHLSRRFGALDLGPLVEHIRYREEDAWKGGARVALRVAAALRVIGQVVGPSTEVRVGVSWER